MIRPGRLLAYNKATAGPYTCGVSSPEVSTAYRAPRFRKKRCSENMVLTVARKQFIIS